MDDLSTGISLKNADEIGKLEADQAQRILLGAPTAEIDRADVLVWVADRFGTSVLEFCPPWKREEAIWITRRFAEEIKIKHVRWLSDHLDTSDYRARHAKAKAKFVQKMTDSIQESAAYFEEKVSNKANRRRRIRIREQVWLVKNVLAPRATRNLLNAFGPERVVEVTDTLSRRLGEGSLQRLERILQAIPSLSLRTRFMAERVNNLSRKVREQDYYDHEHAIVGAAYGDVFITADRNLYDQLANRCLIERTRECSIRYGIEALATAIDDETLN